MSEVNKPINNWVLQMDFLFSDISNLKKKNVTEKTQVVVKSERYLWDRADNRNWTTDQKYKKKMTE